MPMARTGGLEQFAGTSLEAGSSADQLHWVTVICVYRGGLHHV